MENLNYCVYFKKTATIEKENAEVVTDQSNAAPFNKNKT